MVLEDVNRSMQDQIFLDPRVKLVVMKGYRLCRTSGEALSSLVAILQVGLEKGRRGRVKVALKKDRLEEMGRKLEAAKATLMLANQIYYQAVQSRR